MDILENIISYLAYFGIAVLILGALSVIYLLFDTQINALLHISPKENEPTAQNAERGKTSR